MLSKTERADIERACERVAILVSDCMDMDRHEEFASYHTQATEFVPPSAYPGPPIIGIEKVLARLKARSPLYVSRHTLSNVVAKALTRTEAECTAYFTHYAGNLSSSQDKLPLPMSGSLVSVGEYHMCFVLQEGQWKIHKRIGRFIFGGAFKPS